MKRALTIPIAFLLISNLFLLLAGVLAPSFAMVKNIYNFNTIIVPVLLLFFACILWIVHRPRHRAQWMQLTAVSGCCVVCAFLLAGARLYMTHYEPNRLCLREISIETDKVTEPLRVLHISDLQVNAVGDYERRAFAQMRGLDADIIVHTGDLLQPQPPATTASELPKVAKLIRSLKPPLGVWGVEGDVDWRLNGLSDESLGGLQVLRNSETVLERNGTQIRILGLTLPHSRIPSRALVATKKWFKQTDARDLTIILGHDPAYAEAVTNMPVDICLAGHTHGGQIRIPWIGALLTMSSAPREWSRGFRTIGQARLNVSAGIGSEHKDGVPPMRLNCPSEMTLIEFIPKQ